MGKFALALLWVGLAACSFDSNTDSVGGASLGDDDSGGTSGGSNTTMVSESSASAGSTLPSGESSKGPTTAEPTTTTTGSAASTDPTSDTNAENTATESATSQGSSSDTTPATGSTTTGTPGEPYGDCPSGGDDECEDGESCQTITIDMKGDPVIVGSWCGEAGCDNDNDCPLPSEGTAVPDCRGPAVSPFCTLDCAAAGAGCPTGMNCETFWSASANDYVDNCVWPVK